MNRLMIRWVGFCLGVCLQGQSFGQATRSATPSSLPERLSLEEAKRIAFEQNWDLLAAHSDVDLAVAQRLVAKEFPNPTLTLGSTKIRTDSNPQSTLAGNSLWHRNYDTVVAIGQLFEIGGKRRARKESAAAGLKAAEHRLIDARRLLDESVSSAYVAALLADENVKVFNQSAAALRKEAEIAQRRLGAGDISSAEKTQIEIVAQRLELDANSAATNALQSRVALEVLLGIGHPEGSWNPSDSLSNLVNTSASSELGGAGWVGIRPDVAAADASLEKASAELRLQRAMRIPDPTVQLQYEHEPADAPNTLGLVVSFPLPLWNQNRGAIRAATAAQHQAELTAQRARAEAEGQVVSARAAYLDSLQRWTRYREQLSPQSASVRETVVFAYSKGGASLLDLLSAERNDNEIRLATAQAMADAATKAATLKSVLNLGAKSGP